VDVGILPNHVYLVSFVCVIVIIAFFAFSSICVGGLEYCIVWLLSLDILEIASAAFRLDSKAQQVVSELRVSVLEEDV